MDGTLAGQVSGARAPGPRGPARRERDGVGDCRIGIRLRRVLVVPPAGPMMARRFAFVLGILLMRAVPLQAQRWERQVLDRLERAIAAIGTSRRSAVVSRSGTLNQDESALMEAPAV